MVHITLIILSELFSFTMLWYYKWTLFCRNLFYIFDFSLEFSINSYLPNRRFLSVYVLRNHLDFEDLFVILADLNKISVSPFEGFLFPLWMTLDENGDALLVQFEVILLSFRPMLEELHSFKKNNRRAYRLKKIWWRIWFVVVLHFSYRITIIVHQNFRFEKKKLFQRWILWKYKNHFWNITLYKVSCVFWSSFRMVLIIIRFYLEDYYNCGVLSFYKRVSCF